MFQCRVRDVQQGERCSSWVKRELQHVPVVSMGMVFGVPSWLNKNKSLVLMSQQSSIGLMRVVTARFALVFFYGNQCKAC